MNYNYNKIRYAIAFGHFWIDFYANVLASTMYLLARDLHLSLTRQGILVAVVSFAGSVMQPYLGYLVDKKGKSTYLLFSLLLMGLLTTATGLFQNFYPVLILFTLGALGSALYHPLGSVLTTSISEKKNTAVSFYVTWGNIGYSIAPVILVPAVEALGRKGLLLFSLPMFLALIFLYLSKSHQLPLPHEERKETLPSFRATIKSAFLGLLLLNLIVWGRAWIQVALGNYSIQYFLHQGLSANQSSILLSAYLLAGTAGVVAGGFVSEKHGERFTLLATFLLSGATLIMMFFTPPPFSYLGMLITGFLLNMSFPATIVMGQNLIPENAGMVSGMMMGLAFGLGGMGAMLTGTVADYTSLAFSLKLLVVIPFIISALTLVYFQKISLPKPKIK
ncbi:MFS transporter [Carboxydothermus ferrireducens]|uniref:FSR family fosmidomycin resistance protein-like MFS transporter n=1 Tax=Carboxydothermus ferrireducens DSM 11255 TaxID=1119529 RepID=A0ABX2RCL6_9THEO|nr:MFS transporter [Carboxydothermus ferrireducens]NYE57851.1 FSR family fosmidomycin resistance protein-like MFS transporter [Carboxydothermus ferrireducens DSM 11255]